MCDYVVVLLLREVESHGVMNSLFIYFLASQKVWFVANIYRGKKTICCEGNCNSVMLFRTKLSTYVMQRQFNLFRTLAKLYVCCKLNALSRLVIQCLLFHLNRTYSCLLFRMSLPIGFFLRRVLSIVMSSRCVALPCLIRHDFVWFRLIWF